MNKNQDPEAAETVQTTSNQAVAPVALCSALPIVITTDGAVRMQIGVQQFTLQYSAVDTESLDWMAEQLRFALERAGAATRVSDFRKCRRCVSPVYCDSTQECVDSVLCTKGGDWKIESGVHVCVPNTQEVAGEALPPSICSPSSE